MVLNFEKKYFNAGSLGVLPEFPKTQWSISDGFILKYFNAEKIDLSGKRSHLLLTTPLILPSSWEKIWSPFINEKFVSWPVPIKKGKG